MRTIVSLNQDPGISPDRAKGAAVHLQAMRDAFADLGVNVIAIDNSDEASVASQLNALGADGSIDLIYERYALGKHAAARTAADFGIPLVIEANAPLAQEQKNWRGVTESAQDLCNDAILFHTASAVIGVSHAVADYAVRRGASRERVHVYGNGIDRRRFNMAARRLSVRTSKGFEKKFVLGFHGRVRPWHGFERLVQVFDDLRRQKYPVHLLVVGEGEFDALASLPKTSYTRVGWQTHEKVPEFVAAFDALPFAYDHDVPYYFSPLKLMEAMACGVVPVVPDLGDLASTVAHRETGLVYPAKDTDRMTRQLAWLIDHPRERVQMAMRAASFAAQFTWERIASFVLRYAKDRATSAESAESRSA